MQLLRLKRALPAAAAHVAAYRGLVSAAAIEWKKGAARGVTLACVALTLAISAVVVACGWVLLSVWDKPARHWIAAAIVAALAVGALAATRRASAALLPGPQVNRLKAEWNEDLALLGEMRDRNVL